jgi:hypothetical protein
VNLLDLFRAPMLGGDAQHLVHDVDSNVSFRPTVRRWSTSGRTLPKTAGSTC